MVITWFGLSCLRISSGDLAVVTDPFSKTTGLTPPRVQTDVAIISNSDKEAYNNLDSLASPQRSAAGLGGHRFVIDGPGEFDVKGLFVHGIASRSATIYSIRMENILLGFLGSLKQKELTDEQLESLGEVDILLVPAGGKTVCDAEEAVSIINQIEPHIVIPMHYAQSGLRMSLDKLDTFLKEIGAKANGQDKLTIKKSEIGDQESQVVILNPVR